MTTTLPAGDVFVINTPLQLLNAIEASAAYGSTQPHLLILHWKRWPRKAFEGLLQGSTWSSITWLPLDIERPRWHFPPTRVSDALAEYVWVWRRARQRRLLESAFQRYGSGIRILAVGNYCQPFMRHVLNTIPHRRGVALDDGTDSLKAAEQRRREFGHPVDTSDRSAFSLSSLKARVNAKWVDLNDRHPDSEVEFFTVYDLPSMPVATIRRHAFERLRSTLRYQRGGSEVFFLGQPLAEDGYISASDFEALLRKVKRYYANEDLIYVPHKRETRLSRGIAASVGLKISEFDDPIEIVLATGQRQPRVMSSFFCSALENCGIIFGNLVDIHAVRVPAAMLLDAHEAVERIYAYLEQSKSAKIKFIEV